MSDARYDAIALYHRLSGALGMRPGESLHCAAKRVVNRRGPQIMAAQLVLSVGDKVGDEQWEILAKADVAAQSCRWVRQRKGLGEG